jgi:hypothetical protein
MCIICIEWEKERMTSREAMRAMGESITSKTDPETLEHLQELSDRILKKEIPTLDEDTQRAAEEEFIRNDVGDE